MSRIATAPAALRWEPHFTAGFVVYDVPAEAMVRLRAEYRRERAAGHSPALARTLALAIAVPKDRVRAWIPNARRWPWHRL